MTRNTVGIVIERLLTDEDLRVRFALDRIDTLALLRAHGFELTSDEIDLFILGGCSSVVLGQRSCR
jgi:hypothetical protein